MNISDKDKDSWVKELLKNMWTRNIIIILLASLVVFFIVSGIQHIYLTNKGVHSKFFWVETNLPIDNHIVSEIKQLPLKDSSNRIPKYDLKGSKFIGNNQIGDGNTQNINTKNINLEPKLSESEIKEVSDSIFRFKIRYNISSNYVHIFPVPGNNARIILSQLLKSLPKFGHRASASLSIGGNIPLSKGVTFNLEKMEDPKDNFVGIYLNEF